MSYLNSDKFKSEMKDIEKDIKDFSIDLDLLNNEKAFKREIEETLNDYDYAVDQNSRFMRKPLEAAAIALKKKDVFDMSVFEHTLAYSPKTIEDFYSRYTSLYIDKVYKLKL